MQKLHLGRNAIDKLPADAFAGLTYLDLLDLRENNLKEIDPSVFRDGMAHLVHLYLNGNQLTNIPYSQLSSLKRMKVLDLSYNRISRMLNMQQEPEIRGLQMSLDTLHLDYNQIEILMPGDFQHFFKVNRTYLNGNPLTEIEVRFRDFEISFKSRSFVRWLLDWGFGGFLFFLVLMSSVIIVLKSFVAFAGFVIYGVGTVHYKFYFYY